MAAANIRDFQLNIPEAAQNAEFKLGSDITVPCHLSPEISAVDMEIRWFKETDCICLYKNRKVTEAKEYKNKASLFTEELDRGNVSLRLQRFTESDLGDYVCQVISGDTTEELTVNVQEGYILQEPERTPEEPQKGDLLSYIAAGALVGAVCTPVGAAAGAAVVQKKKKKRNKKKRHKKKRNKNKKAGGTTAGVVGAVRGRAGAAAVQQPLQPAEAVRRRIITFSKVNREWNEQERQKMERSFMLTELYKHSKLIEDKEICLAEKDKKIEDLEMDKTILLKDKDQLQKTIQWKDKILEEKDILLQKSNEKLLQTTREAEERQKQIVEKNTQLENMNKLVSEKERELKQTVKEMEDSKFKLATLRTELQENVRQLEEEVARIRKKPSSQTTVPRRRNSKENLPPKMSGETSNLGSELRLVLLGSAGSEKSSAGNIILNREKNDTDTSTESHQSERRQEEVEGKQVIVVETPDWFCSGLSLEEVRQDMRRCVSLSAPGPHTFLLVIPVQQMTGAEREMLEKMEEIFGEKCWRNTLILFTVTDEKQEMNIEGFVQNQEIQRLVQKCGNRFHCLNIHKSEDASQVSELLEKIEKMVEGNTERFYSSEIYLENKEEREELNKKQEEENRQMLDWEVQNVLCKFKTVISKLEERITELEQ